MDETFMAQALAEARLAAEEGEVPIGAVVVADGRVVGRGRNARERLRDPTAHAEIQALQEASRALGSWRLSGGDDVRDPRALSDVRRSAGQRAHRPLVYGVADPKAGAVDTLFDLVRDGRLNHRVQVASGILQQECGEILREFFRQRRKQV